MDYITYFIQENKKKSYLDLMSIYLNTLDMDKPEEKYLASSIKMGLFYIIKDRFPQKLKKFETMRKILE